MKLILEYFSWCEGGTKSSIDPGDRVSSSVSEEEEEEEEEEAIIEKKKKRLLGRRRSDY